MINNSTIKVSVKYEKMLETIEHDKHGYWAYSNPGYYFSANKCHIAYGQKASELLEQIRTLKPCNCKCCMHQLETL